MANHFVDSREECLQERRVVGLVVTQDKVDRRRLALKRTADDRPTKEVSSIIRQQRYPASRRNEGYRHGEIFDPVRGLKVEPRPSNIVFNDRAEHRGLVRHPDERLTDEILEADRLARRETMIARQNGDERFPDQDLVNEIGVLLLRPQECRV